MTLARHFCPTEGFTDPEQSEGRYEFPVGRDPTGGDVDCRKTMVAPVALLDSVLH